MNPTSSLDNQITAAETPKSFCPILNQARTQHGDFVHLPHIPALAGKLGAIGIAIFTASPIVESRITPTEPESFGFPHPGTNQIPNCFFPDKCPFPETAHFFAGRPPRAGLTNSNKDAALPRTQRVGYFLSRPPCPGGFLEPNSRLLQYYLESG